MSKNLLIIKAASDVCAAETDQLKVIASMFDIAHHTVRLKDTTVFAKELPTAVSYDYGSSGICVRT